MKILKYTLVPTLLAATTLAANDGFIDSIGVNVGSSYSDASQENNTGAITLGNEPDTNFNSIELYTTLNPISNLCKQNGMKPYISYTYAQNSDLKHQYLLAGINKYYSLSSTKLQHYAGVVAGYGQMEWRYDPLNSSNSKNTDANSFTAGVQIGSAYPLNDMLSLNVNAKYLLHNYETKLATTNANSKIEHEDTAIVGIGLEYSF